MDAILQDLRYSLRRLRRAPGFALVAVLTLALGIGANTAIFSFINGLLFKSPAGVQQPDRLITIFTADFSSSPYSNSSWPDYEDFRRERTIFTDLAAIVTTPVNVSRADQIERLSAEIVTPNYFTVLGMRPVAGRLLSPTDAGDGDLLVLNEDVWRTRFGGDPSLIGRTLNVNGRTYTLIGIAPARFYGVTVGTRIDAWVPIQATAHLLGSDLTQGRRDSRGISIVGRLQPGVSVARAQARLDVLQGQLFASYRDA